MCLDHQDGTLENVDREELTGQVVEHIGSFRPDVVITFGPDGGYGHPDHIAISAATAAACRRSGERNQFPEQLAAGLQHHRPARLFHSSFPPKRQLLLEQLVQWLMQAEKRFRGTLDFAYALLLLCEEATLLRYSGDHFDVNWYPANFSIIEQGEQANRQGEGQTMGATTCIDADRYLPQKIASIAAHRSQYAIEADMLPLPFLQELMGREYFVRIHPAPEIETELLPASAAATQLVHS